MKSNSITQSFLNESFGAFVDEILDFASSTGNETIVVRTSTLWLELQINRVFLENKSPARPGSNLFLVIILFNGEQWNVRNIIPLNSFVLYW